MIELIVSVCFILEPQRCKDVRLNLASDQDGGTVVSSVTPQQCMMYGQFEIAKWTEGHPNWRVTRWTCGIAGQVAKI